MKEGGSNPEAVHAISGPELVTDLNAELVDAKVDAVMQINPEAEQLLDQIRVSRGKPEEKNLVLKMKQLREYTREDVEKELGIFRSPENEKAQLEEQHRENMQEMLKSIDGSESENILLAKMGMLNADGQFEFPEQIFSPDTNKKWHEYLRTVKKGTAAINLANQLHITSADVAKIDLLRVKAHDEVTEAVRQEMGETLSFEDARRLLAKMREMSIPNSGELKTTASAAWELVEKARQKYGEQAA